MIPGTSSIERGPVLVADLSITAAATLLRLNLVVILLFAFG
jgi:hypothetical protein